MNDTTLARQLLEKFQLPTEVEDFIREALSRSKETELDMSYSEAFSELNSIVRQLKSMQIPDVDVIIPMMERSMALYKICKKRIDSVEKYRLSIEDSE